jgi:predicted metal-dependent peptidase
VCKQVGLEEVWWLDVDCKAYKKPEIVSLRDIPKLPILGRGGTSFHPGIDAVLKMKQKPDLVIYMTDGDGHAPPQGPKGVSWIWCIVPTPYSGTPAEWGKIVICEDKKERT